MRLLFELSGEYDTLPAAEALAVCRSVEGNAREVISEPGVLVVEMDCDESKFPLSRPAYTHAIHRHIFSCPHSELEPRMHEAVAAGMFPARGSVCIRVNGFGDGRSLIPKGELEKMLGGAFYPAHSVNLTQPDISVRVLSQKQCHAGLTLYQQAKPPFSARKPAKRPFFSPVSIMPKMARAMVNLANVKSPDRLLDPFCGTGGILIEAGMMGLKFVGSDLEWKMVEGARKNLYHYGLDNSGLFRADIGDVAQVLDSQGAGELFARSPGRCGMFDAIVTDVPYGRACGTRGENVTTIYERLFRTASGLLDAGKRLVLVIHDPSLAVPGKDFRLIQKFSCRVHRSLTRHLMVFERT